MKVWIATPSLTGTVTCEFANSLAETMVACSLSGIDASWHVLAHANLLHFARDQMAREFMASDSTDLLFIDDDMQWDAIELLQMLDRPEPVVGALVPTQRGWNAGFNGRRKQELKGCAYLGTGIMRIKRSVLELIGRPYFDARYEDDRRIGEDAWFCREVQRHGGEIWAMQLSVSHRGLGVKSNSRAA